MDLSFRKTFLALEAVCYVAIGSKKHPVRSKDIAEYMHLTVRYLEPILQSLVHEGVLKSIRGPKGGYVLAKERRNISMVDVSRAVLAIDRDESEKIFKLSPVGEKIIVPMARDAKEHMRTLYSGITVSDVVEDITRRKLLEVDEKGDFTI